MNRAVMGASSWIVRRFGNSVWRWLRTDTTTVDCTFYVHVDGIHRQPASGMIYCLFPTISGIAKNGIGCDDVKRSGARDEIKVEIKSYYVSFPENAFETCLFFVLF